MSVKQTKYRPRGNETKRYAPSVIRLQSVVLHGHAEWLTNSNGVGRMGKVQGPRVQGAPKFQANNADIVLSPTQNLQVTTVHKYVGRMGVLCTWVADHARMQQRRLHSSKDSRVAM